MRRRIIEAYARFIARRLRMVLLGCLALAGVAVALLPRLEFRTARSALTSAEDPDMVRFEDYLEELGPNAVLCLAKGGTEPERRAFIERLAVELSQEKGQVDEVFYKLPLEFFRNRALGLLSLAELRGLAEGLEKESATLAGLSSARGLADLNRLFRARIEKDLKSGRRPQEQDPAGLRTLRDLVLAQHRVIERPVEAAANLEKLNLFGLLNVLKPGDPSLARLSRGGYLASTDGSMYLALVQRRDLSDSPDRLKDFLAAIRRAAETARSGRPAVTYGLTGNPVLIVEEAETVSRDAAFCSIFAVTGIGLLALLAFRRKLGVALILLSLAIGILWNLGLTWAIFGGINLITSSVPVILLALGIDFGIHVVLAYEAARARGRSAQEAIEGALVRVGPGLATGALTTALAFYAICFMEYRGFREFGVVAGNGVLVCLLAMVSALPALLVATDRRRWNPGPSAPARENEEKVVEEPPPLVPPSARLRRWWRLACRAATAMPTLSMIAAAALTLYFLYLAAGIGFDYRVEDLLPHEAESVRTQRDLKAGPARDLGPDFAVVFASDRKGLEAADRRAKDEKLIRRRESILALLPEGTPARAELMQVIQRLLAPVAVDPDRLGRVDPAALRSSIEELSNVFQRALDLAINLKGGEETVRLLDEVINTLDASAQALHSPPPGWTQEFAEAQRKVWAWARVRQTEVERMLALGPVEESDIPVEILHRLKGPRSGRYVLYLYPEEDLDEREALKRFVDAARRVDPGATGYPLVFYASTSLIHRGFSTAVVAAAVVIFLTLFLDFRRIQMVLLACLPKAIGIIWMLGFMRILGLNYNLANQVVIPLLIGVGLAYGIHIIHRFFMQKPGERNITQVLEHTGAAIALSGLTTMIGFGSLALAKHRGLASMGIVLFFGVGAALAASTYVLANLLTLIYRPKR